jgi:hypothetical protein
VKPTHIPEILDLVDPVVVLREEQVLQGLRVVEADRGRHPERHYVESKIGSH